VDLNGLLQGPLVGFVNTVMDLYFYLDRCVKVFSLTQILNWRRQRYFTL